MFQENCYVASDETNDCVIIDCGAFYEEERQAVVDYIKKNELNPRHLIATHAHIDHNFGNNTIYQEFGLKPEVCSDDECLITRLREQVMAFIGMEYDTTIPPVGRYLEKRDTIIFGNHVLTIIPTPGHTPGSVFFYCEKENLAFSGDTLFQMSIGRTDFEYGSFDEIIKSLHYIASVMPDDTTILPGHGSQTTIGMEKRMNPYMK